MMKGSIFILGLKEWLALCPFASEAQKASVEEYSSGTLITVNSSRLSVLLLTDQSLSVHLFSHTLPYMEKTLSTSECS